MKDIDYTHQISEMKGSHLLQAIDKSSIVAFTDIKGNIIYANDKFCEISKYSREELLGQNHRILKSGHHSHEFFVDLWKTIASGNIWTGEIKNRAKDGTYYWVYTTILPFLNEHGRPYQYAAIRIDITQRKMVEEERNTAIIRINNLTVEQEAYEKFVLTLAHDLRSPLSVAKMSAQLIQRNPEITDSINYLVTKIENNINRIDEMIKDLLDTSRINKGLKLSITVDECDVHEICESTLNDLSGIYGNRFILKTSDNIKGYWSASGLRRIIENLCTNAIKYGDPYRPITLNLTTTRESLELIVHNEGRPLLEDEMKDIFDYLYRTNSANFSNKKGWGIGLGLVRGMVAAHGGTVEVKSNSVEGTFFIIQLPMDARPFQEKGKGPTL